MTPDPAAAGAAALELLHEFTDHEDVVLRLTWSPDGKTLASTSVDRTIRLWDLESGRMEMALYGHSQGVNEVAWGPNREWLASASFDQTIRIWDLYTEQTIRELRGHTGDVTSIALSPDAKILASASADHTVRLWRTDVWEPFEVFSIHKSDVHRVAWSPDGKLASCSNDGGVVVWASDRSSVWNKRFGRAGSRPSSLAWSHDHSVLAICMFEGVVGLVEQFADSLRNVVVLEGHTDIVRSAVFSFDDRVLASSSMDGTVRLWRTDTWEQVAVIQEPNSGYWPQGIAFHPTQPILATFGQEDRDIRVWRVDIDKLLGIEPVIEQAHYRNAKVVLLGDTGVGKTGLRIVLTGEKYAESDSTYARRVWTFESFEAEADGRKEQRETLLWDMAGQPAYRLIHQLHLNEVAVALVVFDARQAVGDPLAGVRHWARALRQARQREGADAARLAAFLVIGRADVQGTPVSPERIETAKREWGFDGFFETSAKEGWGMEALANAVKGAIAWDALPSVSSPQLFEELKSFLIAQKSSGRVLATSDDLFRSFRSAHQDLAGGPDLRANFEICVGRLENRDLVRRLSFGGFILLQPELLDAYASAMVLAAQSEEAGASGSLAEEDILAGRFRMPLGERLPDQAQERLLVLATIQELLRHQLALREHSEEGPYLVFPSQFNRDWPDAPDPEGKWLTIRFEGPVQNIYATLAVRLAHSGAFTTSRASMWRNAALFEADAGGECGLYLREFDDGAGELVLFSRRKDARAGTTPETRFRFEGFVRSHLGRNALAGTVTVQRLFVCGECGNAVPQPYVKMLRARGLQRFDCPCGGKVLLVEPREQIDLEREAVNAMESASDRGRNLGVSDIVVKGKEELGEYDVFLCYNFRDRDAMMEIARGLRERKIRPWLDVWELRAGDVWIDRIGEIITKVKSAAVFIGPNQTGPFENIEIRALLRQFVDSGVRVIPVILSGAEGEPSWSVFMQDFHRVDFRKPQPDPMGELLYGITGIRALI